MAAYEILLLNTTIPQIQAAQSGDTYVVPRDIAFSTVASFAAGAEATPSIVATGDTNTGIWFPAADTVAISTGGISRLRLDSSGNLGLGVTPSGWATYKAFQIGYGSSVSGHTTVPITGVGANYYFDGTNYKYITSNYASRFLVDGYVGGFSWSVASSGTGGTSFTFTQAMTLDASGNLGVGATSPFADTNYRSVDIRGTTGGEVVMGSLSTREATITADGTNGMILNTTNATPLRFYTQGNERARITSDGSFLVGTTSNTYGVSGVILNSAAIVSGLATTDGYNNINSANLEGPSGRVIVNHSNGASSGSLYVGFGYNNAGIGSITQNGTTGVLYNITSDYRLKDVVGAITGAGARIDALKPVAYTWKANGSAARGFLAHEFQAVYPNSVTGAKDAVDEEGKPVYQNMQASTSEVIADLVAELQSLRARVAQLEGK